MESQSDEDLLERLDRLKAKQERGEELTDEELEQLFDDLDALIAGFEPLVETVSDVMSDVIRDLNDALQPLMEFYEEYEDKIESLEDEDNGE